MGIDSILRKVEFALNLRYQLATLMSRHTSGNRRESDFHLPVVLKILTPAVIYHGPTMYD